LDERTESAMLKPGIPIETPRSAEKSYAPQQRLPMQIEQIGHGRDIGLHGWSKDETFYQGGCESET
jgi:hypothetical protein